MGDSDSRRRRLCVRARRIGQRVYSVAKEFDRQIHETPGLSVFAIALIRLAWRAFDAAPDNVPVPPWMSLSSKVVHATIQFLLLAIPVSRA